MHSSSWRTDFVGFELCLTFCPTYRVMLNKYTVLVKKSFSAKVIARTPQTDEPDRSLYLDHYSGGSRTVKKCIGLEDLEDTQKLILRLILHTLFLKSYAFRPLLRPGPRMSLRGDDCPVCPWICPVNLDLSCVIWRKHARQLTQVFIDEKGQNVV